MPDRIVDRILEIKRLLKIKSNRELEKGGLEGDDWLLSNGLIATWNEKDPALFTSPTLESFLTHYRINREWFRTGKGEVFIVKPTLVTESDKKNTDRDEISILIKNLNRYGETNEYLLGRVKDLEEYIKGKGLLPPL